MTPQQIKQVLVRLAAEDKLPLDMNDLDESVFIPKMRTVREHILSLPERIRKLIPEDFWIYDEDPEPNPISAVGGVIVIEDDELVSYLQSITPFGRFSEHIITSPLEADPKYIWNL